MVRTARRRCASGGAPRFAAYLAGLAWVTAIVAHLVRGVFDRRFETAAPPSADGTRPGSPRTRPSAADPRRQARQRRHRRRPRRPAGRPGGRAIGEGDVAPGGGRGTFSGGAASGVAALPHARDRAGLPGTQPPWRPGLEIALLIGDDRVVLVDTGGFGVHPLLARRLAAHGVAPGRRDRRPGDPLALRPRRELPALPGGGDLDQQARAHVGGRAASPSLTPLRSCTPPSWPPARACGGSNPHGGVGSRSLAGRGAGRSAANPAVPVGILVLLTDALVSPSLFLLAVRFLDFRGAERRFGDGHRNQ
jgi:hypothetical protein